MLFVCRRTALEESVRTVIAYFVGVTGIKCRLTKQGLSKRGARGAMGRQGKSAGTNGQALCGADRSLKAKESKACHNFIINSRGSSPTLI